MNENISKIKWDSLMYEIEFNLDKRVNYDQKYTKALLYHCSINKLLKNYNEELLTHNANYWVDLIYGERRFIYKFLEAYRMLKKYYSIDEDIIEYLKINFFNKKFKDKLITESAKDTVDEVLISYYGVTAGQVFKIGIKNDDVLQFFTINYVKAKNLVEARLQAEKEFGFSEKVTEGMHAGQTIYVFVEQIPDVNLEYEKVNKLDTDMEAAFKLKKRLMESLGSIIKEIEAL
jgi:hypothetical protein